MRESRHYRPMMSSRWRSALAQQRALGCCIPGLASPSGLGAVVSPRSASMTPNTASSIEGPRSRWKDSSGSACEGTRRPGTGGCGTTGGGTECGATTGGARGSGGGPPPWRLRNEVSPKASPPRPTCIVCLKSPRGAEIESAPRSSRFLGLAGPSCFNTGICGDIGLSELPHPSGRPNSVLIPQSQPQNALIKQDYGGTIIVS